MPTRRIFISVAEDSADMHAAALIERAARDLPDCTFYGLAGPRMRQAGAEGLLDLTPHAAMLTGVAGLLRRGWRAVRTVERAWRCHPPDLAVLVDSGTLHLPLARRAHRLGIPVLYYIAPQTWASRAYRNRTLAGCVDHLACILPFEPDYFRSVGVRATFVGHPLFEAIAREQPDEWRVRRLRAGDGPLVALLPGSRRQVIASLLPRQLEVLRRLQRRGLPVRAAVSSMSLRASQQIQDIMRSYGVRAELVEGDLPSLLTACDLALVASGSATLHVAAYGRPMIVLYDAGRLLRFPWRLAGRRAIHTPHLALVNVLAGRRVVPEFMPFVPDVEPLVCLAEQLLRDAVWRERMVADLEQVVAPLRDSHASRRVCQLIGDMLSARRRVAQPA